MNRPRKLNWNEVYLRLGFGRHNQSRKVVENNLKTSGGKKNEECLIPLNFACDVSSLEAVSCNTDEEIWKLYMNSFQLINMNLFEVIDTHSEVGSVSTWKCKLYIFCKIKDCIIDTMN